MRPETERQILEEFAKARDGVKAPVDASSLELRPSDYTDGARLQAEMSAVFRRAWVPAAPVEALSSAGKVAALDLAGEPLVLTRDEHGVVRALRNVCVHRGAQIVRTPRSSVRTLRCPYHGFEYGLDGALARRPAEQSFANSAKVACDERARLGEFECESFGGWWWVRLERGGAPLQSVLGVELLDELENYPLSELRVLVEREFEAAFDWKVGVEAFLEPLHVPTIHTRSAHPLVDYRGMAARELGDHSRMALPFRVPRAYEADGPLGELAQRAGVSLFPALNTVQRQAHLVYFVFPCLILMLFPNHLLALRFLPLGVGRCSVRWELRALPASSTSAQEWLDSLAPGYERLIEEDLDNLPWIQRGLASPSLERLQLSEYERRIVYFRRALERWLA